MLDAIFHLQRNKATSKAGKKLTAAYNFLVLLKRLRVVLWQAAAAAPHMPFFKQAVFQM